MKNIFLFLIFSILLIFIFYKNFNSPLGLIGKSIITEKDIRDKIKIERAYGNLNFNRTIAFISLVNDLLEYEVARQFRILPTKEEILAFKRYAETNSKAPDILMKVKQIFGKDEARYEKIYLTPKITNYKLRAFYSRNYKFHKKEREKIEQAYFLILKGESFSSVAQKLNLQRSEIELKEKIEVPKLLQGIVSGENKLLEIIKNVPPGSIYKGVIEDDFGFMIIKNLGKTNNGWRLETIFIAKTPFDNWFKQEASNLKIEIRNKKIKEEIKNKYSNVWWVKLIY